MRISYLECTRCGERLSADRPQNVCPKDGGVLFVRYDLASLKGKLHREDLSGRVASMWRYADVLPELPAGEKPVTLGEGFTPMLPSREHANVYIKDEGLNPTGSFKARGMSAAVTMSRHYGLKKLAAPSAGNAGGALAAYAAAAGIEAYIFMPKDVPLANRMECDYYGAHVTLVDGLISDCGRMVAERKDKEGWFDVSTLKEPFRVEGKKTMGYEVAEQLGWKLPQGIIYPTGGGVGMIGMWKAFDEMEEMGWIGPERPKDDHCAGGRVRADRACMGRGKERFRNVGWRRDLCRWPARAQGLWRLPDSRDTQEKPGRRGRCDRRGNPRGHATLGQRGGRIRRA